MKKKLILILCFSITTTQAKTLNPIDTDVTSLFELFGTNLGYNLWACMLGAFIGSIANICTRLQRGVLQTNKNPILTIIANIFINMFIAFMFFLFLNSGLYAIFWDSRLDPMSQFIVVILSAFLGDSISEDLFRFLRDKIEKYIGKKKDGGE